jgi:rhomboid family GlyGly-CTERM serine protease
MNAFCTGIKGARRHAGASLLAGCIACLVFFVPVASSQLQYDRDRIGAGEIWRLLTSHWTHWSAEHLFWDGAVFMVFFLWSLRINARYTWIILGSASLVIPCGIYWLLPEMRYYRGLSGLDAALFAFVVMHLIRIMKRNEDRTGRILSLILLAGLGLKITFEAITGEAVFVGNMATDVIVVPLAHIIGVGIGLPAAYLTRLANISAVPTATFDPRM